MLVPPYKAEGQKRFLNGRYPLYYKSRIFDDSLACRTKGRQDRCSATSPNKISFIDIEPFNLNITTIYAKKINIINKKYTAVCISYDNIL